MESKAESIVKNVGAIAETVSVFYNSISKQVPKDVALVLTQHFMDLTINRRPVGGLVLSSNLASAIAAAQAKEAQRQPEKQPQEEKPEKPEPEKPEPTEPENQE